MDIQKMIKEAQAMQKSISEAQSELSKIEVKGISGNGLVEILMSAKGEMKNVKIKKEAVNPDDVETLEDLILSAFKNANQKAMSVSEETLKKITGNYNLPKF